jgi:hypothetical protein
MSRNLILSELGRLGNSMFDPFTSYTIAQEIAHLIINITGDRTRVAKIVEFRSHPRWKVERYTGSDWVEG